MDRSIAQESDDKLTTAQVAEELGITAGHVRAFITAGRLPGTREGATWLVARSDLRKFKASWRKGPQAGRRIRPHPEAVWDALEALRALGPSSSAELALAVNRHEGNVRKYVGILRHRGFITTDEYGHHTVTEAGLEHLAERGQFAPAS